MTPICKARKAFAGLIARDGARVDGMQVDIGYIGSEFQQDGLRVPQGTGRSAQEGIDDGGDGILHFGFVAYPVYEADLCRGRRAESIAAKQMMAQEADPECPQKNRDQLRRWKSEAHLGDGEESVWGRQHRVAARSQRETGADAGALHDDNSWLVESFDARAQLRNRNLGSCIMPDARHVCTAAEMPSLGAEQDDTDAFVAIPAIAAVVQGRKNILVESVPFFRSVECDGDYPARTLLDGNFRRWICHERFLEMRRPMH